MGSLESSHPIGARVGALSHVPLSVCVEADRPTDLFRKYGSSMVGPLVAIATRFRKTSAKILNHLRPPAHDAKDGHVATYKERLIQYLRDERDHLKSPLHLFCRVKDLGLSAAEARALCARFEKKEISVGGVLARALYKTMPRNAWRMTQRAARPIYGIHDRIMQIVPRFRG